MAINASLVLAACLLLAGAARADEAAQPLPAIGDAVYKGLVGKALDAVPMDPNERVTLQRTSAVVSGTLTGRSLSAWAGLTHPILLIAGAVWGLFSASNIQPAQAKAKPGATRAVAPVEPVESVEPVEPVQVAQSQVALLTAPPDSANGNQHGVAESLGIVDQRHDLRLEAQ